MNQIRLVKGRLKNHVQRERNSGEGISANRVIRDLKVDLVVVSGEAFPARS